jgi:hypothetical protein
MAEAAGDSELSAFSRPAVATDRLPGTLPSLGRRFSSDSRRIATYVDGKGRRWSLYIFKRQIRRREDICVFVFQGGGGGGGCDPSSSFFVPGRQIVASAGHVLAGVASPAVARVEVIGSRGLVHHVALSTDHGFIFDCGAYNGCTCVVARLEAFDRSGRLITNQNWLGQNCRRQ